MIRVNEGHLRASGAGGIVINSGGFKTSGVVVVDEGSTLRRTGTYRQESGETTVEGVLLTTFDYRQTDGVTTITGTLDAMRDYVQEGGTTLIGPAGSAVVTSDYTQDGGSTVVDGTLNPARTVVVAGTQKGKWRLSGFSSPTQGDHHVNQEAVRHSDRTGLSGLL